MSEEIEEIESIYDVDDEEYDIIADIIADEDAPQPHILWDMNYLFDSFLRSMKDSDWKSQPQEFEQDVLFNLAELSISLKDHTYVPDPTSEFVLSERGKTRYVHGNTIRDRVIRHNLCDNILTPLISRLIIYNNGASQKGKGISFSRAQFEKHLHNFYLKYHDNNGYVLFVDFSKFYDNIIHDQVRELFKGLLDEESAWLFDDIVESFNIDITQYPNIDPNAKFDSIAFHLMTSVDSTDLEERWLNKGIDIGDQTSQNIGVFYPTEIDKYATIVRQHRWYGRYMDDIYIIHRDKDYLLETYQGIRKLSDKYGLFINERKLRLCKLSDTYKYLQIKYFLTDSGKVVKRINPTSITRERRRLKGYRRLLDKSAISYEVVKQAYKSWIGAYYKIMSKDQIAHIQNFYGQLFGERLRYKG